MRHALAMLFAALSTVLVVLPDAHAADPSAGRATAEQWCANCHRVAATGPGPVSDAVPAFTAIARNPAATAAGLSTFLRVPHAGMPDLRLTLRQSEDLSAYILSLRP